MNLISLYIVCGIITWITLAQIIPLLKKDFLAKPNKRSAHLTPIPSGGGISFVLVSCFFCYFSGYFLPIYCLPLAIIGFLDDKFKVPAYLRYIFQLGTVLFILKRSENIENLFSNLNIYESFSCLLLLIIFGTAIINFINFMDGLDGFICLNMILVFLFSAFSINDGIFFIVFALIGFIFWNWEPAKVFMGDVGSTFLGALLFGIIVNSGSIMDSISVLVIIFPILTDAFTCVIRRFFRGQNIFEAHKLHLYQRLNQAGFSHSSVTIIYFLTSFMLFCSVLLLNIYLIYLCLLLVILIGYIIDKKFALPFN